VSGGQAVKTLQEMAILAKLAQRKAYSAGAKYMGCCHDAYNYGFCCGMRQAETDMEVTEFDLRRTRKNAQDKMLVYFDNMELFKAFLGLTHPIFLEKIRKGVIFLEFQNYWDKAYDGEGPIEPAFLAGIDAGIQQALLERRAACREG
jgi:hypothetical protein